MVGARGWTLVTPITPTFTDVPADSPFFQYVETAVVHNVISGYADHTFHPGSNATAASYPRSCSQHIQTRCAAFQNKRLVLN